MDRVFERRLAELRAAGSKGLLKGGRKGLEKESLRVTPDGWIARTPHPVALGSALTHPYVTTDYSEALPELRTPPCFGVRETIQFLHELHQFVYAGFECEMLWAASMPCRLEGEDSIPIADYGRSNVGMMKHVYRRGLGHRYGRIMQAIAGVHFNYSLPEAFWPVYQAVARDPRALSDFISDSYLGLLRNFQRCGWLVCYLFGSSPAVDKSFLGAASQGLERFDDVTRYSPFATSLRMSDIGYQSKAQAGLGISYDNLNAYVTSLARATQTPYPEYERIGVVVDGEYRQLNTSILQIENEYYSLIRPKQITLPGEKPSCALKRRGVQYVELRAIDVDPFDPLGVTESELRFLEALLVCCLLHESPPISAEERREIDANQRSVTRTGRDPAVALFQGAAPRALKDWASEIGAAMQPVCELLDEGETERPYARALEFYMDAVRDPDRTPSARMLAEMRRERESFFDFALRRSQAHADYFKDLNLSEARRAYLSEAARESLARQNEIEVADNMAFDEYLKGYFAQV